MPNGATSGVSDSIQPSTPNLEAAYAVQNSWPTMPAVEEIVTTQAGALGAHDRKDRAGDVHRAEQGGLDLRPEVLGADLLEEPGVEVAGVVDQHVDASEPVDGSLDGRLGVGGVGDVELDGQEVARPGPRPLLTVSVLRAVATTAWPAARAALAMSTPMPRPAPVMNQTFLSVMLRVHFLLVDVRGGTRSTTPDPGAAKPPGVLFGFWRTDPGEVAGPYASVRECHFAAVSVNGRAGGLGTACPSRDRRS